MAGNAQITDSMNERTDILQPGDNRVELTVMGVFEFEGGKISASLMTYLVFRPCWPRA